MRKQDFIKELRINLSFLPKEEIEDRISFYCELIDDKIEEGLKEEDAIKSIGSVDEIINQIINDMPLCSCNIFVLTISFVAYYFFHF